MFVHSQADHECKFVQMNSGIEVADGFDKNGCQVQLTNDQRLIFSGKQAFHLFDTVSKTFTKLDTLPQ